MDAAIDQLEYIKIRQLNLAAYCVLAATIALALIASGFGWISWFELGYLAGSAMLPGILVFAVLVALSARMNSVAKAYARLATSMIVLLVVALFCARQWTDRQQLVHAAEDFESTFEGNVRAFDNEVRDTTGARPDAPDLPHLDRDDASSTDPKQLSESERHLAFLRSSEDLIERWGQQATELQRQFSSVDLSTALTPEMLTSAKGIADSRRKVQRLEELIEQRETALAEFLALSLARIDSADLTSSERAQARAEFLASSNRTEEMYQELGNAQKASLAAITEVLDFAETIQGSVVAKNGRILFATQTQLDTYERLMSNIQRVVAQEDATTKRALEMQQESRDAMRSMQR